MNISINKYHHSILHQCTKELAFFNMEANVSMIIRVCGGLGFLLVVWAYAWRFYNWVWLTPKNTEKFLRDQGLKGTSYKFLYGDVKEIVKMITEASLKPINLTDDILPRVLSFAHNAVTTHGIYFCYHFHALLKTFQLVRVCMFLQ